MLKSINSRRNSEYIYKKMPRSIPMSRQRSRTDECRIPGSRGLAHSITAGRPLSLLSLYLSLASRLTYTISIPRLLTFYIFGPSFDCVYETGLILVKVTGSVTRKVFGTHKTNGLREEED